jgi:HTH-type transcriptional regulator/antitoxin HigA
MRTRHTHPVDIASAKAMVETFTRAVKTIPLLGAERTEKEYHQALALIEFLVDHDDLENPLFELLSARIRDYEKNAPAFRALNQCLEQTPHGIAVLRTLMEHYGLKASDLANELGSKSNVSNILKGRRALTVSHIKALSERFGLPADAFIE